MRSEMYIPLQIQETKYIGNNRIVVTERKQSRTASGTAKHETAHVFAAKLQGIGVKEATVRPNHREGYRGRVITHKPNAVVAAAAHALGHDGTGHDLRVANMLGDQNSATAAARSILSGQEEGMNRFAVQLDQEGTMSGSRVDTVFQEIATTEEVAVYIKHEDGRQRIEYMEAENGRVMIPNIWVHLAKAA